MAGPDRAKALEMALAQIDKNFGKGSVMRLGDEVRAPIAVIPTGSIALDIALGIGGLPRGRVVEIYGPESSGKCLTAGTYVWTDIGLETVAELFGRAGVTLAGLPRVTDVRELGLRAVNERGELEPVAALTHNGLRPVTRLRLSSGRTVEATANHPLRVLGDDGVVWREAGRIRVGDVVVSAAFGAVEAAGGDGVTEGLAALLGYLVAGATEVGPDRLRFRHDDAEVAAECAGLAAQHFPGLAVRAGDGGCEVLGTAALREVLSVRCGLELVAPERPAVPQSVRTGGHKAQRAFLSALFEADARVDPSSGIALSAASARLASEVQLLLYGLGVPAQASTTQSGPVVSVESAPFLREVGVRSSRRRAELLVPGATPVAERPTGQACTYEPVVAVDDGGLQPTFDLVLPATHSFLANGMLSHNTTVALHAVANAQAAGGIAAFIDAEHALDPEYAKRLGVDTDALLVSQPDTGEQALEIADMLVRSGALDILVIDSVAALVPRAEIEGEMGDSHVGLQARLMSQALRKMTGALANTNTTAIFINQLREKIGVMFGSPETTTGGKALKFYASIRIDVRRIETLKDGTEAVGNRTRAKVVKNKMAPPFKQAEFDIVYGVGISREGSLIDMGVEHGIVRKSGAWYTYEGDQLGQGKENARAFLRDNPDLADEIEKRIKEKLGVGAQVDAEAELLAPVPIDL